MRDFWLTEPELNELRTAHRSERNRHEAYKLNAVILLGSGWKLKEVKAALLLDDETLRSYVQKYRAGGLKELLQSHYQGRACHLDDEQLSGFCQALESRIFLTTAEVIEYVEQAYGICYTASGMRDLLHRMGYEYKKPKLVPGSVDRQAQETFVEYYEQHMEHKSPQEKVFFVDAVHPQHNTMAAYGWIRKGQTRALLTNSGRQRLNLHGAIHAETLEMTVLESPSINTDFTIALLESLNQKYPLSTRLTIILDNARYHYSQEVRQYLSNNRRIHLVFLPSYFPQLNLVERVWKFFKKKVLYNRYYQSLQDFREAAQNFFSHIGQYDKELSSLLSGGFEGGY